MPGAARTAEGQRNNGAGALGVSPCPIEVGRCVAEMERILSGDHDYSARMRALAILQRWQFDEMLDAASRRRARQLVLQFARNGWDEA